MDNNKAGTLHWAERRLLHRGGPEATWGNLGLWRGTGGDYAGACAELARAVARAAGVQAGERVLSLACGAGDELLLWASEFGAAEVAGVEAEPVLQAAAQALSGATVVQARVDGAAVPGLAAASFDRVLCVDAAYLVRPRSALLQTAAKMLRPGGRLAFTDMVVNGSNPAFQRLMLGPGARIAGLGLDQLLDDAATQQRVQGSGFGDVQLQRLDDEVLGGFTRYVRRQGGQVGAMAISRAWRRPAITATLIPACRFFGLGYALVSATRSAGAPA